MLFFHAIFHAIFFMLFSCNFFMLFSLKITVFTVLSGRIQNPVASVWYHHMPLFSNVETQVSADWPLLPTVWPFPSCCQSPCLQLLAGLLPLPFCLWGTLLPLSLWPPNCRLSLWARLLSHLSASGAAHLCLCRSATAIAQSVNSELSSTVDNETQWNRLITVKAAKEPKPGSRNYLRAKVRV